MLLCTFLSMAPVDTHPTRALLAGVVPCPIGNPTPGQPYHQEEIANPQQTCASGTNNFKANGDFCRACDIYVDIAMKQQGDFAQTSPRDHVLVMPTKPCRGVEDANSVPACGGEGIWDAAWRAVVGDSKQFGLAVNPTARRTRHQLHIHVAKMLPSLQKSLAEVASHKDTSWIGISCTRTKVGTGQGVLGYF